MIRLMKAYPYRLGLIAVALLGLLCAMVVMLSLVSFGKKTYTAHLQHTAGLRAGEDVQVAGVSVGEVKSVELSGTEVIATFTLDKDIRLGSETRAMVRVATLLGTHMLKVDPRGAGELPDNTIPQSQTEVPYNLQDVLEVGASKLGELDAKGLAKALTAVTEAMKSGSSELRPALEGIQRVSTVLSTRMTQAGDLLLAAKSVSDQLSKSSKDIVELMRMSQLVLDEVVRRRAVLHELLVDVTALARSLKAITVEADEELGPTLKDLNVTLDTLRAHDKDLTETLRVMAPTARYIANIGGNGPWLDVYLPGAVFDGLNCTLGGC